MRTLILILFLSTTLAAQVPDTIFVESLTDSTFLIATGKKNTKNDKLNITYIDQVFDSAGVANFTFNRIANNEEAQRKADLIKLKADALTALYGDVNSILQDYTGAGYLSNAFQKFSDEYMGFYRATLNASLIFFQLKADATAVQVNAQGTEVQGGYSGTWDVITGSRWRLKDFLPVAILPASSVLNRLDSDDKSFQAVGSGVVITKIQ